jgi:hypothetical protein
VNRQTDRQREKKSFQTKNKYIPSTTNDAAGKVSTGGIKYNARECVLKYVFVQILDICKFFKDNLIEICLQQFEVMMKDFKTLKL